MNNRIFVLLGIIAPFITYLSIAASILISPWFSWQSSALSDLGHSVKSDAAPIFNFGLFFTGFITIIYALTTLKQHARYTNFCLIASAVILQLIAVFDEVYGFLHGLMAVLFFLSIWTTSIVNAIEKKSILALLAFIIGVGSWILRALEIYNAGIAVPELISFAAVATLIQYSALKIYLRKD